MRVLVVKTSSMGDVIHTLPALTDAARAIADIRFDWVVEEAFAPIAAAHSHVDQVLPCAIRRWRKSPLKTWRSKEWQGFRDALQARDYDCVIDAQGLVKSAFITRLARGEKVGLDRASAREPLSARVLDRALAIPRQTHAIHRVRQLFAAALGYACPQTAPDYGLPRQARPRPLAAGSRLVFVHGTTWPTKHWPETYWQSLTSLALQAGCEVNLPWGSEQERERAERIAGGQPGTVVLPRQGLGDLLETLSGMDGFVAVDTGLAHLAAAAGLSGVALYGPTDPSLTGVLGARSTSLAADFACAPCVQERCRYRGAEHQEVQPPCFGRLPPERVWQALVAEMNR